MGFSLFSAPTFLGLLKLTVNLDASSGYYSGPRTNFLICVITNFVGWNLFDPSLLIVQDFTFNCDIPLSLRKRYRTLARDIYYRIKARRKHAIDATEARLKRVVI